MPTFQCRKVEIRIEALKYRVFSLVVKTVKMGIASRASRVLSKNLAQ